MPTENRSSNTEMVSVPFVREDRYIVIKRSDLMKVPVNYRSALVDPMLSLLSHLPRRECLVIESDWPEYQPTWEAIEARVTGKPAEQHQGEPVAWVRFRNGEPDYDGDAVMIMNVPGDTIGDGDSWEAVYTHADPGEVERLVAANTEYARRHLEQQGEVERLRGIIRMHEKTVREQADHLAYMRAHLAENGALLREWVDSGSAWKKPSPELIQKTYSTLSASAEPSAPDCDHCAGAGHDYYGEKCAHCKSSAPVERDERVAFEKAFSAMGRPLTRADYHPDAYGNAFDDGAWTGWQARAALERKPS